VSPRHRSRPLSIHWGGWARPITAVALGVGVVCTTSLVAAGSAREHNVGRSDIPKLVAAYSAGNNHANATLSTAAQANDEAGTSLFIDDSWFTFAKRAGFKNEEGVGKYYSFSFSPLASSIAAGLKSPGSFATLARWTYAKGTPKADQYPKGTESLLVFTSKSAAAGWRVALYPVMTIGFGTLATTNAGYAISPTTTGRAFTIAQIPRDVAAALSHFATTGKYVPGLIPADFTGTGHAWSLPNLHTLITSDAKHGFVETDTVAPYAAGDVHSYALTNGDTLVTFSEKIVYRISYPKTFLVYKSTKGEPNTWEIKAGDYQWVKFPLVCELAAIDSPAGHAATTGTRMPKLVGASCGDVLGATGRPT
jgi:hypothetical protein